VAVLALMLCAPVRAAELDGFEEEADVVTKAGAGTGLGGAKAKASSFASKVRTVPSSAASPSVMPGRCRTLQPKAIGQRSATGDTRGRTAIPPRSRNLRLACFRFLFEPSRRSDRKHACRAPPNGLASAQRGRREPHVAHSCAKLAARRGTGAGCTEGRHRGVGHQGRATRAQHHLCLPALNGSSAGG